MVICKLHCLNNVTIIVLCDIHNRLLRVDVFWEVLMCYLWLNFNAYINK